MENKKENGVLNLIINGLPSKQYDNLDRMLKCLEEF